MSSLRDKFKKDPNMIPVGEEPPTDEIVQGLLELQQEKRDEEEKERTITIKDDDGNVIAEIKQKKVEE